MYFCILEVVSLNKGGTFLKELTVVLHGLGVIQDNLVLSAVLLCCLEF